MPKRKNGEVLNRRERLFVLEYLVDHNATAAARRAGYSAKAAGQIGYENLKRPEIEAAIAQEQTARSARLRYDADKLLRRLCEEAEADIADLFDADGALKTIAEWPLIWRKGLVASIDVEEIYEGKGQERRATGKLTRVRFADRTKRLELIGRHIKVNAWRDTKVHDVADPLREFYALISGNAIGPKKRS